jgi:chromosome segregation ATPase
MNWWRGQDLNLRPSGYEPDELPGCSTPRRSRHSTVAIGYATHNLSLIMFSRSKKTQQAIAALNADLATLRAELNTHIEHLAAEKSLRNDIADRLTVLEGRVSGMGSELSRQMHELSDEIERLSHATSTNEGETVLTQLRASQTRLATEQARYEIAFRQDLATLAEMLRRKS